MTKNCIASNSKARPKYDIRQAKLQANTLSILLREEDALKLKLPTFYLIQHPWILTVTLKEKKLKSTITVMMKELTKNDIASDGAYTYTGMYNTSPIAMRLVTGTNISTRKNICQRRALVTQPLVSKEFTRHSSRKLVKGRNTWSWRYIIRNGACTSMVKILTEMNIKRLSLRMKHRKSSLLLWSYAMARLRPLQKDWKASWMNFTCGA